MPHHTQWNVQHNRRALVPIVVMVAMAIVAMMLVALSAVTMGIDVAVVATGLAFLPVIPIAMLFLWIDRWEPEPGRMLLAAFLWGASIAIVAAVIGSLLFNLTWMAVLPTSNELALSLSITAPVVEEVCKGLFLVWLFWFRRREFDGVVDGIVYAGLVGLGFAFTENIFYLSAALREEGLEGGLVLFILRCVMSPFAHPLFTVMFGIGLGLAVQSRYKSVKVLAPVVGLVLGMVLHGLWNGSTLILDGVGFLYVYALVMIPTFVATIVLVVWQRRRLQKVVARQLPAMVSAQLIPPHEVPHLACLVSRGRWREHVRRQYGSEVEKGLRDYHAVVTEIAILFDRIERGAIGDGQEKLKEELFAGLYEVKARARNYPAALSAASKTVNHPNPYLRT
ncbi:PrsW family intramembrane metalloprotease [Hoyosella rhizosphaerae]|uniref:Membrane protein n=2 Tax=Hoyosella rhizosphaerae TaxID=1755582 RepID=A0A916XB94_9ACTN|nr:PrsW family intramembrane metalloprotease [Hoyosella rhizosphaerae]GGC58121.1 membrane protein [Hoyosella rhizosphaerae]